MSSPSLEPVELRRAESGLDLWSAIEAAQYARVLRHDPAETDEEARAIDAFVGVFAASTEAWEETPESNRTPVFETLGVQVQALARLGLFVRWAVVERDLGMPGQDSLSIPVAILAIDRIDKQIAVLMVPREIDAGSAGPEAEA